MDGEANLPVPPDPAPKNLVRPSFGQDTSSSSSSSSSQEFLRHIQAAFKRHRPLGTMQIGATGARRSVAPQREASRSSSLNLGPKAAVNRSHDVISLREHRAAKHSTQDGRMTNTAVVESVEHASITPPSISSTITQTFDENFNLLDRQMDQPESAIKTKERDLPIETRNSDDQRNDQPLTSNYFASQDMEWDASNQGEASDPAANNEAKHPNFQTIDSKSLKSDRPGPSSSLAKIQGQLHEFKNFLNQPVTRCSVVGSSCATTTSVQSTCAPMLNATTCASRCFLENNNDGMPELLTDSNANAQCDIRKGDMLHSLHPTHKDVSVMQLDQGATRAQISSSANHDLDSKETDKPNNRKGISVSETPVVSAQDNNLNAEAPLSKDLHPSGTTQPSKPEKHEKVGKGTSVPRKRNYDPDLFFKVNGKLYQRLGKIGSGGSSEVHKVISSDCTIYALKKIKLKGRDYGTAYGFCQEIEYLNKLKGKNNIIQLVDYEVTDKTLLREVMSGTMSIKDGRVRDDAYIYMVLEYGEIDLAHMLSQKWKEIEGSNKSIDENWLRFYWQQILQAVNTIHEERIVHSDLKPANFLLVKGFLKLIDFGIAKAIMSDTTNIQRDSQVGTLSYMSPEAFMCNESDADGNTIKCGRPSDIWSLGCILYQMVYGRTPFAEYKTFWAKFKIITDPNHEITYAPVSNPWLLDLMKKCLAWDRNKRWRIPELLEHPFLVPPIPTDPQDKYNHLSQLNSQSYGTDQFVSGLSSQLIRLATSDQLTSREGQRMLLSDLSNLCVQLQQHLAISEGD